MGYVVMNDVDNILFLTDGNKNVICVPYSEDNLHKMAKKLGISNRFFRKTHYVIPDAIRDNVEEYCEKVTSKTLFRTLYSI